MTDFIKVAACTLVVLILWITLSKGGRDFSLLITIAGCAMICIAGIYYLQSVVGFVDRMKEFGDLDNDLLSAVLKVVGIGMISEITVLICKDAGNESMGKALQLVSSMVVLCVAIPVFEKLITLLDEILGTI